MSREVAQHARESPEEKTVERPRDWPWNSLSFYSNHKQGLTGRTPPAELHATGENSKPRPFESHKPSAPRRIERTIHDGIGIIR